MTIAEWLGAREPTPPPTLARRIAELTVTSDSGPADAAVICLIAAERALPALLSAKDVSRQSALDLLAVDALVTYAFEAASDQPDRIPDLATSAMAQLSRAVPSV
jgi:hypothetical protein